MKKIKKLSTGNYTEYIIAVIILTVLITIRITFISQNNNITVYSDLSGNTVTVLNNNKKINKEIQGGASLDSLTYSEDKSKCVFNVYTNDKNGAFYSVYIVSGNKCRLICEKSTGDFVLSQNGDYIAYLDFSSKLCLYSVNTKSTKTIAQNCDKFSLSPDGKSVIFTSFDDSGLSYIMYLYTNDKVTELSTELLPVAVTNKAEIIYATNLSGNTLYKLTSADTEKEKIISSLNGKIYFNNDLSQFTVSNNNGTYFYYDNANVKLIIKDKSAHPVFSEIINLSNAENSYIIQTDNLVNKYYITEKDTETEKSEIYFTDKNGGQTLIEANADSVEYCENKNKLVYSSDNNLFIAECDKTEKIADNISSFSYCENDKIVFTDSKNTVYRHSHSKNYTVTDNVSDYILAPNGNLFILKSDNTLYFNKKGKAISEIQRNISSLSSSADSTYIYYYTQNEDKTYNKYSSLSKNKFKLIEENVKYYY